MHASSRYAASSSGERFSRASKKSSRMAGFLSPTIWLPSGLYFSMREFATEALIKRQYSDVLSLGIDQIRQLSAKPSLGISPIVIGCCDRNSQRFGGIFP